MAANPQTALYSPVKRYIIEARVRTPSAVFNLVLWLARIFFPSDRRKVHSHLVYVCVCWAAIVKITVMEKIIYDLLLKINRHLRIYCRVKIVSEVISATRHFQTITKTYDVFALHMHVMN